MVLVLNKGSKPTICLKAVPPPKASGAFKQNSMYFCDNFVPLSSSAAPNENAAARQPVGIKENIKLVAQNCSAYPLKTIKRQHICTCAACLRWLLGYLLVSSTIQRGGRSVSRWPTELILGGWGVAVWARRSGSAHILTWTYPSV